MPLKVAKAKFYVWKCYFHYAELNTKYKNQAILALNAQPTISIVFAARKLSDMRPDDPEAASSPVHGFKRDLIRLIGNLSHGNKENQDLVRIIHRDLSIPTKRVLWVTFWRPFMYRPKMGIVKTRKLSVRPKIILFSKTVQDYGNRSADICLVMQAVGQAGHSLSMR